MARKNKIILAGTSLEEPSDAVVSAALELARGWNAELHLHHAYALPVACFAAPTGLSAFSPDLFETERQLRESLLDEQLGRCGMGREDLAGTTIEPGVPHRMLLEIATILAADLIVVGASETPGRLLRGNTADRVLRQAACPVWVVGAAHLRLPPARVLAPVDLSPLSAQCLSRGLDLMAQLQGCGEAAIDALFVLTAEEHESSTQFTPDQIERLAHDELERFTDQLDLAEDHRIRRTVRIGEVRDEILREVEEGQTSLVMIGTHGRSGFERFMLGSVASDVASRAPCDVLVIPPPQATSGRASARGQVKAGSSQPAEAGHSA